MNRSFEIITSLQYSRKAATAQAEAFQSGKKYQDMQKACSLGPSRTGIMKTRPFPLSGGADAKGFPTAVRKPEGGPEASRDIRDMSPKSRKRTQTCDSPAAAGSP